MSFGPYRDHDERNDNPDRNFNESMHGYNPCTLRNHSNGTGAIENGVDLTRGSDLNRALAFAGMEREHLPGWNANQPLEHARSADDH